MIYLAHFGLREAPFGITPDTAFYYACHSTQEALNTLLVAVANGEGFIKVIGEVGTGKTLLCRKFLGKLGEAYASAYLPNPDLEPRTLLLALAEELGVRLDKTMDQHHLLKGLKLALLRFARERKRVVVCLDEAQAMPIETLETLRLLTNLETEKRKLLQVILFGQPELDTKLAHRSIRQLRQRITFQHRLDALSKDETESYLRHRLAVAGHNGAEVFSRAATRRIHGASGGIPRLVNILAHKAMMLVYGEGGHRVERRHVQAAVSDTPAARGWPVTAMSLINKMLQDLDTRNAGRPAGEANRLGPQTRSISAARIGSDWFWRVLAFVTLVAVVWVAWLIWELRPRGVVTELALRAPRPPVSASKGGVFPVEATPDAARTQARDPPDSAPPDAPRTDGLRLTRELAIPGGVRTNGK